MSDDERQWGIRGERRQQPYQPKLLSIILAAILLVGLGYLLAKHREKDEQRRIGSTEFNEIVATVREKRDELKVQHLAGTVTTVANTMGGWGKILHGTMKVKQPWSVDYFVDLRDLTLNDYKWDEATRTLIVRSPAVKPAPPNIDETKQVVAYDGPFITRDMQTRLRGQIARGAQAQASAEAMKPENMAAASRAARDAIASNLKAPLAAAGIRNVHVEVQMPTDGTRNSERWDESRSIADVLAERAAR